MVKNLPANAGNARELGSIPGLGRSPGVGNGNSLQCSSLEISKDRGARQATVHEVTKSWVQLFEHTHMHCIPQGALYPVLYGDLNGKEIQKRGDTCTGRAASLWSTVETNRTL